MTKREAARKAREEARNKAKEEAKEAEGSALDIGGGEGEKEEQINSSSK